MNRVHLILLFGINGILLFFGLWIGVPVFTLDREQPEKRSHDEVQAFVAGVTNFEKLRAIVVADDVSIRTEKNLSAVWRGGASWMSAFAVIVSASNIVLFTLYARKRKHHPDA
jgi:hypothetical protein